VIFNLVGAWAFLTLDSNLGSGYLFGKIWVGLGFSVSPHQWSRMCRMFLFIHDVETPVGLGFGLVA